MANDPLFITIALGAFGLLLSIVGYNVKKMIADMEKREAARSKDFKAISEKLLEGINEIKDQVRELKTENQLQSAALREVEGRVEFRLQGVESRLNDKRTKIAQLESRVTKLEALIERITTHHNMHHPTDKL